MASHVQTCQAMTKKQTPCTRIPNYGYKYCYQHRHYDPSSPPSAPESPKSPIVLTTDKLMSVTLKPNKLYKVDDFYLMLYANQKPIVVDLKQVVTQTCMPKEGFSRSLGAEYLREEIEKQQYSLFVYDSESLNDIVALCIATIQEDEKGKEYVYITTVCNQATPKAKQYRFGIYVMYHLMKYFIEQKGITDFALTAAYEELITYYEKWGFVLGTTCGAFFHDKDPISEEHKKAKSEYESDEQPSIQDYIKKVATIGKKVYKDEEGYHMTFCNASLQKIHRYLHKHL